MNKTNKIAYLTLSLTLFLLTGCSTLLKKEDILLEAQKIKAAAVHQPDEISTVQPVIEQPLPLPTPIPLAVPLPEPAQEKLSEQERLVYKAKYLGIAIGDFTLMDKGKVILNGRSAYCFEIDVKTLPFFAVLFNTKDRYVSYMDPEKFVVLRHEEYIKNGTVLESTVDFDYANHTATYKNFINHQEKKVAIADKILDVLSGGFYLRMIPWSIGDTHEVDLYADEKVYNFIGLLHSRNTITTPKGEKQDTILFKPYVFLDGKQITKVSAEVSFSTTEAKVPLRAILKTPLGNVTVVLTGS